jgi:mRNA interferase RelE/StbE
VTLTWRIEFAKSAKKELKAIDHQAQRDIRNYLRTRIATDKDPRRFGDPLSKNLSGLWKYRIGNYRIICDIQDNVLLVLVVRIGHRRLVYGGH